MRLIDADELKVNCVCLNAFCVDGRTIENAPTVKAIPIEWIEKWVDMLKERNYHSYQVLMPALIEMLEGWEKENGRD